MTRRNIEILEKNAVDILGPQVFVLDVGHGNCTVIMDSHSTVIVDAGPGAVLMEFLLTQGISSIDKIVISHADSDHISGLIAIFSSQQFSVGEIWINSDAFKTSKAWENLRFEIQELEESGQLKVVGSICRGNRIDTAIEGLLIDVLSPRRAVALLGPNGKSVTPNTMSAVLRISYDGHPFILLPGDMDARAFDEMLSIEQSLKADYLVLPHHGGRWGSGRALSELVSNLCEMVQPNEVIISNGRGRFDNPRPEVIGAVRLTVPDAHVSCTQLSKSCAIDVPLENTGLNESVFSAGKEGNACCAGSIVLSMRPDSLMVRDYSAHDAFVDAFSNTALCRKRSQSLPD